MADWDAFALPLAAGLAIGWALVLSPARREWGGLSKGLGQFNVSRGAKWLLPFQTCATICHFGAETNIPSLQHQPCNQQRRCCEYLIE